MESRRPRLGDNIDDYCPRERRLANHVVVAIIGDDVKQTRCTTCDTEHPYKNAKVAKGLSDEAYRYYKDGFQPWRLNGRTIRGGGCPA